MSAHALTRRLQNASRTLSSPNSLLTEATVTQDDERSTIARSSQSDTELQILSIVSTIVNHNLYPAGSDADSDTPHDSSNVDGACCRICLDPVGTYVSEHSSDTNGDHESVCLGCRCSSAFMHYDCARKWFSVRTNFTCEVCCSDCTTLPESLKAEVSRYQTQAALGQLQHTGQTVSTQNGTAPWRQEDAVVSIQVGNSTNTSGGLLVNARRFMHRMNLALEPLPFPFRDVQSYLAAYATFCLLPGMLFSLAVLFFSYRVIHASVALTMILAVLLSSVTIIHWVYSPSRTLGHVLFCATLLGCTLGSIIIFQYSIPVLTPDLQVILGSVLGMALCLLLNILVITPVVNAIHAMLLNAWAARAQSAATNATAAVPALPNSLTRSTTAQRRNQVRPGAVTALPMTSTVSMQADIAAAGVTTPGSDTRVTTALTRQASMANSRRDTRTSHVDMNTPSVSLQSDGHGRDVHVHVPALVWTTPSIGSGMV